MVKPAKQNKKLYQHRPQIAKTNSCGHHVHSPKVGRHPPHHHSTLQRHPAMAPRPILQSWSSPSPPNQSTLQWHLAIAPRPLRQSHRVHSPKAGRHPPPTIAHYNGTLQWHHVHSAKHPAMPARPLPQSWSSPSPPTIAHYHSTLQWHPAMAPRPLNPCPQP